MKKEGFEGASGRYARTSNGEKLLQNRIYYYQVRVTFLAALISMFHGYGDNVRVTRRRSN